MYTSFWQHYHFRIDPWGTDYDASVGIQQDETPMHHTIDPTVEQQNWQQCKPTATPVLPRKIVFIDGRRRLDARFLGKEGQEIIYGAFATIAVGAVVIDCMSRQASCLTPVIRRAIALGGNRPPPLTRIPCPLGSCAQLTYDMLLTDTHNDARTPLTLIQKAMLLEEAKLAMQLDEDRDTLVIRDGPLLHQPYKVPQHTLGYVKTMGKAYLSGDYAHLLWQLAIGERTPIFAIGHNGHPQKHWSWYLRSGQVNTTLHPHQHLHGLVRLDVYGEVALAKTKQLADLSTFLIPHYASHPSRDPRAPQNLTPVGALEKQLSRYMGDKLVIERRLRSFLSS